MLSRYSAWRLGHARLPALAVDRLHRPGGGGEVRHAAVDRQRRLVDAAQLLGAGMDMHQLLLGHRQVEQRVAAGRRLAEARPDGDDEIAGLEALAQRRADADAEIAGIVGMTVVEQVLVAERGAHRQIVGLDEGADVGAGLGAPAAAAHDHHRPLGRLEQLAQPGHVARRRRAAGDLVGAGIGHLDLVGQHVLGQRQHDRTRPAVQRACGMPGSPVRECGGRPRSGSTHLAIWPNMRR